MNNNEWFQNFQIQKVCASVPKSAVFLMRADRTGTVEKIVNILLS